MQDPDSPTEPRRDYEFDADQNHVIEQLAAGVGLTGVIARGVGAMYLFLAGGAAWRWTASGGSLLGVLLYLGVAAALLVLGLWMFRAGTAFSRVVETHGTDILHLMQALRHLRDLFLTLVVLLVAGGAVGVVLFVLHLLGWA